jgi:hypothetical protein
MAKPPGETDNSFYDFGSSILDVGCTPLGCLLFILFVVVVAFIAGLTHLVG